MVNAENERAGEVRPAAEGEIADAGVVAPARAAHRSFPREPQGWRLVSSLLSVPTDQLKQPHARMQKYHDAPNNLQARADAAFNRASTSADSGCEVARAAHRVYAHCAVENAGKVYTKKHSRVCRQ